MTALAPARLCSRATGVGGLRTKEALIARIRLARGYVLYTANFLPPDGPPRLRGKAGNCQMMYVSSC